MQSPGVAIAVSLIFIVIIINFIILVRRSINSSGKKGRGRNYIPPDEQKRIEWRDKEIARRIEREQDDALECIKLRNETLSYYEAVRLKYEKKEAMERLGIEVDDNKLEEVTGIVPDEYKYRDVRDDLYVVEKKED